MYQLQAALDEFARVLSAGGKLLITSRSCSVHGPPDFCDLLGSVSAAVAEQFTILNLELTPMRKERLFP